MLFSVWNLLICSSHLELNQFWYLMDAPCLLRKKWKRPAESKYWTVLICKQISVFHTMINFQSWKSSGISLAVISGKLSFNAVLCHLIYISKSSKPLLRDFIPKIEMHFTNESTFIEEGSKSLSISSCNILKVSGLPNLVTFGQIYFFSVRFYIK